MYGEGERTREPHTTPITPIREGERTREPHREGERTREPHREGERTREPHTTPITPIREGERTRDPRTTPSTPHRSDNPATISPPQRSRPSRGVFEIPGQSTIVFVTACARNRDPWLASAAVHNALINVWIDAQGWLVGRYVVMPDHVHFFASPGEGSFELETWARYWKRLLSRRLGSRAGKWQSLHWDSRIRSGQTYEEKWDYVLHNPVRHGLVETPEQWPYKGEVHELRWSSII